MENKEDQKISEQSLALLAVQCEKLIKARCSVNGEVIRNVEVCGKIVRICKGPFSAEIFIEDFTGITKVVTYFIEDKQGYYGLSEKTDENLYVKVYCIARVEEKSVCLVVKLVRVVGTRAEVNEFFTEALIWGLRPCKAGLGAQVLQVLWENQHRKMGARSVQDGLNTYVSLFHIEKELMSLVDQGKVDYGSDFDTFVYIN